MAYITKKHNHALCTNSKFETHSEKKIKITTRMYPSYNKSCLFIQPAAEAKKFVQVAGTEWCTLLIKYVTSNCKQPFAVVAGDDKNFAASVATSRCDALCANHHSSGYLCRPQAPICSVQLQDGHQNLWFLFRRRHCQMKNQTAWPSLAVIMCLVCPDVFGFHLGHFISMSDQCCLCGGRSGQGISDWRMIQLLERLILITTIKNTNRLKKLMR